MEKKNHTWKVAFHCVLFSWSRGKVNFHNNVPEKRQYSKSTESIGKIPFACFVNLTLAMEIPFDQQFGLKLRNFPLSPLRWPHFLWKAVDKKLSSDSTQVPVPAPGAVGNQDSPQNASLVSTLSKNRR